MLYRYSNVSWNFEIGTVQLRHIRENIRDKYSVRQNNVSDPAIFLTAASFNLAVVMTAAASLQQRLSKFRNENRQLRIYAKM